MMWVMKKSQRSWRQKCRVASMRASKTSTRWGRKSALSRRARHGSASIW